MRRGEIVRIILGIIGVAGVIVVAASCPNIGMLIPKHKRRAYRPKAISDATRRLLRKKWIVMRPGSRLMLTERGYAELLAYEFKEKTLENGTWDHKWRLLFFDIAEWKRSMRDRLRRTLKQYGFKQIQRSVWVYPFECRDILALLKLQQRIRQEVIYCEVVDSEDTRSLRKLFDFPL